MIIVGVMPASPVIVGTYRDAAEAQLAKGALEAAGIPAVIEEGNKLAVDEHSAQAAEQIVNAMLGIAHAEHVRSAELPERCEQCGSPDVVRRQKLPRFGLFVALTFGIGAAIDNTLAAFYVFLAGIVFFLAAAAWRCRQCGHTW